MNVLKDKLYYDLTFEFNYRVECKLKSKTHLWK
jgi:hypothetical protein